VRKGCSLGSSWKVIQPLELEEEICLAEKTIERMWS
jgi:hypothetical protein